MEQEKSQVIDDKLKELEKSGALAHIFMSNGVKLVGKILKFDAGGILFSSADNEGGVAINRELMASVCRAGERKDKPRR